MVTGIGIDIIEIERIKKSIDNYGDAFLKKIFTPFEINYCESKPNKYQHYAARFAAKEAVSKALTTGWNEIFNWQDVEIINESSGLPKVVLYGKLKEILSGKELMISMSHSHDYVACVAIIQIKENLS